MNLCGKVRLVIGVGFMFSDCKLWFFKDGKVIYYFMGMFIFSEYIVVYVVLVVKVNFVVFFDKICLLGCGIFIGIDFFGKCL